MKLSLIAAGLMSLGLVGVVTPTLAASVASCQDIVTMEPWNGAGEYTSFVDDNLGTIQATLKQKGINATSVANWGGCVKATVVGHDGKTRNEFFDPNTLQRLTTG